MTLRLDTALVLARQATESRLEFLDTSCVRCDEPFSFDTTHAEESRPLCDVCAHQTAEQLGEVVIALASRTHVVPRPIFDCECHPDEDGEHRGFCVARAAR